MLIEKELVKKAAAGDGQAFEHLVTMYEKKVYSLAYKTLGSEQDALDVSQDVFLKVYKYLSGFKQESSFSTWIYSITINSCRDHIRKNKNYDISLMSSDQDEEEYAIEVPDIKYSPEKQYEQKEFIESIKKGIKLLNPSYREVLALRVNGKSYAEIAAILSLDVGTVKSRISRARENLRKYLFDNGTF